MSPGTAFDIGPLTWVKGEIELALDRAGEDLMRYGEAPAEAARLAAARAHLHQASGALSIVGLEGITRFSGAIERLLAAFGEDGAWTPEAGETARKGLATLRSYLDELVNGQPDQPLRLWPAYRELAAAAGLPEPSPAELFLPDLTLRPPPRESEPPPLAPEAAGTRLKAAQLGFDRGLVKWQKGDAKGLTEMRNAVAVIELRQSQPARRAFWWVAMAFLDALVAAPGQDDPGARQLCERIHTRIAKLILGDETTDEDLMRDVLYRVAVAPPVSKHVESVRAAYRLSDFISPEIPPLAEPEALGTEDRSFDAAIQAIRDRLVAVETILDAYFRDTSRQAELAPAVTLMGEAAAELAGLGHARAAEVLGGCRAQVARFSDPDYLPKQQDFEEVARVLSALGLFLDGLGYGSPDIDAILGSPPEPTEPPAPVPETTHEPLPPEPAGQVIPFPEPEPVHVGEISLPPVLYRIYLDEARDHVETLQRERARSGVPSQEVIRAAHTLASTSAAAGVPPIGGLAHALENALVRLAAARAVPVESQRLLVARATGALEGMVGAIAEQRLPPPEEDLTALLDGMQPMAAEPMVEHEAAPPAERRKHRLDDDIDPELLPIFLEESHDLMGEIGAELRAWRAEYGEAGAAQNLRRLLHTLKGSARMAGVMSIGEILHGMETRIAGLGGAQAGPDVLDALDAAFDRAALLAEALRAGPPAAEGRETVEEGAEPHLPERPLLRVRADRVDRLVNDAGEIAVARGRAQVEMGALKASLRELTENVGRLRSQLREIEIQAEIRMESRQVREGGREFDPLEFDRFTRFQELARMMAESVGDVATLQAGLVRRLGQAEAALGVQARLNRQLSQVLMDVRMVPFDTVGERLRRLVRQTARECGRPANLEIFGGETEIDRSVLERITGPLEHLLRNALAHGLESPADRAAAGKPEAGRLELSLAREGGELMIDLADDGRGLDFDRIRATAAARGLLPDPDAADEKTLARLIFLPGFSTAETVTELAGRGIGMDAARNEILGLGGRIDIDSRPGAGTTFRITLPLTLAIAQAVLVRSGARTHALPAAMIEQASKLKPEAVEAVRAAGGSDWMGRHYPLRRLADLLGETPDASVRRPWLLLLKGSQGRMALEVDDVEGKRELVVKDMGPQLARVPGVAGAAVMGDGRVALILNPFLLDDRPAEPPVLAEPVPQPAGPQVLVVDDSITVRSITSRLLARRGYRVATAKDGVDALEQMAESVPELLITDIEMPRMDGFELVRKVRADERLQALPVVVISSRTAEKHREYARSLGVDRYLGKPYDDEELLDLVAKFTGKGD